VARRQDRGKGAKRKTDCHETVSEHAATAWVEKVIKRLDVRAGQSAVDERRVRTDCQPAARRSTLD
jgi:hypothetical protein